MPTQTERRKATRAAVLEATIESLVTHGYAATTTARVADIAGVSRGAAPHYFAGHYVGRDQAAATDALAETRAFLDTHLAPSR